MKWIRKNKLILLLTLIAVLVLSYPLLLFGIEKSFYVSVDPDVVYTTNALLYAKTRVVSYFDHPGTPTILFLSYTFIPLRLIAKYILHQGFIQWTFDNYQFLTFYLRIFQLVVSSITLFIFLRLVESLTKSKIIVVFAFLLIFSSQVLFKSVAISPEAFSLFLAVVWLSVFLKFIKTPKYSLNLLLALISGIAFANKFTNLFLVIPMIFLPFYIQRTKFWQKSVMVAVNVSAAVLSFVLGIKPVLYKLKDIIGWGRSLFTHTEKYGGGAASVFDWKTYSTSVFSLIKSYPFPILFVILAILFILVLLIKRRVKLNDPVVYLNINTILGILIFAKYPTIHYNYVNFLLLIFCTLYFVSKLKTIRIKLMIPILAVVFVFTSYSYFALAREAIANSSPRNIRSVLEVWTPIWSADIFREQLNAIEKTGILKTP